MKKQYINPVCKVLTLNTKKCVMEEIMEVSDMGTEGGGAANRNSMEFDDAVDELIFGKKEQY
ncbi:MAG: hypothetical protein II674_12500 [Prevotella sp.]|nr:hypothetical protein [Prevotella sp.]